MAQKKTEREAIEDVVKRLKKKYPAVSGKHIEGLVNADYEALKNAKLRDYIAVLVEHSAKTKIVAEKHKHD